MIPFTIDSAVSNPKFKLRDSQCSTAWLDALVLIRKCSVSVNETVLSWFGFGLVTNFDRGEKVCYPKPFKATTYILQVKFVGKEMM